VNASNESASSAAIPNVLAERYASGDMKAIWSQHGRVGLERDFWIAVMKAQRDLGVAIPADAIKDYERVKSTIDLAAIAQRERITLHDVKARIEEFPSSRTASSFTSGSPAATSRKTSSNSKFSAPSNSSALRPPPRSSRSPRRPRPTAT
jgi:hypothetical protein